MEVDVQTEAPGDSRVSAQAVLEVIGELYAELHRSTPEPVKLDLASRLVEDLGFDSLARVELLLRLERCFDVQFPERALEQLVSVADVLEFVRAAPRHPAQRGARGVTAPTAATVTIAPDRTQSQRSPSVETPERAATLIEVLDWHVEQHPRLVHAHILDEHGTALTYAELQRGARALAAGLQSSGVRPGATVALMLPTGSSYLEAFLGALLAGAVPVPIYPPTSVTQLEEHVHRHALLLENAQVDTLISVEAAQVVARALQARAPSVRQIVTVADLGARASGPFGPCQVTPDSLALLQYTSGSTGEPKGVMLTHRQLLANIRALGRAIGATPTDVFVSWLPLYHDMGLIGAWLGSLYFGCQLVLMSPLAFLSRPQRWLQAVHQHRGTLTGSPTFGYELCTRRLAEEDLRGLDLSSLRFAFCGAEHVDPDTLERFAARFARCGLPPGALAPAYGLAEAALAITLPPLGRGLHVDCVDRTAMTRTARAEPGNRGDSRTLRFASCGAPLPGYALRIVDAEGAPLPERREGALQFKGPSATAGYYRNPEASARLRRGEWLDTGDRAYLAEGELYVTGRIKEIIIRRGQHIYPEEIETALAGLDGVVPGGVVSFGARDPQGATEKLVVFAETPYSDRLRRAQLIARINSCVAGCIGEPPEDVVLGAPGTALKTASGKLRRAAMRAAYQRGGLAVRTVPALVQLLGLRFEETTLRLRRWLHAGGRTAYGLWAWGVLLAFAASVALRIPLRRDAARAWQIAHQAAVRLIRFLDLPFSVSVPAQLDLSSPHVIVANHCSYADSVFTPAVLATPHRFVAKAELQRSQVLRPLLRGLGTLFVERFAPLQSLADVERVASALRAGHSVIVFPEGTFTAEAGLMGFHLGAFQVAVAARVPVIPIAFQGTRDVLRDGTHLPRRAGVHATIGAALIPDFGAEPFIAAVKLRDAAREHILHYCGEPDRTR